MRFSSFTRSSLTRVFIPFLIFSIHLTLAVDIVIKRDPEAATAQSREVGFNLYIGQATWNNDPGFLTNDGAFIAFARDAFNRMRTQANANNDNIPNPPSAVTVLIVDKKAYISSSITKTQRGGDYKPGALLKLFRQPLYEQDTLDGPTPPFGKSQVLSTLHQCLEEAQKQNSGATDHQLFCGEPVAIDQYFNDAGLPGHNQRDGMSNIKARIVTWGVDKNNNQYVFRPCRGGRDDAPNSIGCDRLVAFLDLPVVTQGTPSNTFPAPDTARAGSLCIDDGDLD
ncbi:MAG: hypothetical protein Q9160_000361 [Pyrenula sp. 1 TL-2023]